MSRKAGSTGLMKKRLRTIIVVGITLALLALVLRRVGLADLLDTLRGADLRYLALSVLVTPLLAGGSVAKWQADRKSTRLNSSHVKNSYSVFCLKKTTSGRYC